jgi:hypothetical protein
MKESNLTLIRRTAFWFFQLLFIVLSPIILFYSFGFKFDSRLHKFIKTGTISITSSPQGIEVSLNENKLDKKTPCVLAELLPGKYTVSLEKEHFYLYKTFVDVKPFFVSKLDVVLVPIVKGMQKIGYDFDVYKFFLTKHLLTERMVIFTNQGIFWADKDFNNLEKLCPDDLGARFAPELNDLKEIDNKLIFWNTQQIGLIDLAQARNEQRPCFTVLYKAKQSIKNVFVGIRDRYIVVQDGLEVICFDMRNSSMVFPIITLTTDYSEIVYESASEVLYVKERMRGAVNFSLYRVELFPSILDKLGKEKNDKTF